MVSIRQPGFVFATLFFVLSFLNTVQAQPIGDPQGFLKRVNHRAAELAIQKALIDQITITNIIKNQSKYQVRDSGGYPVDSVRGDMVMAAPAPAPMARSASGYMAKASSTNLREQGVDEADLVKTDGRYLYALNNKVKNKVLRIYDTQYQGRQLHLVSQIQFNANDYMKGIYLLAPQKKLVVITENYRQAVRKKERSWGNTTLLYFIDIQDKSHPVVTRKVALEGASRSSRRIGNILYLVMNSHTFRLPSTYKTIESSRPISLPQYNQEKQRLINNIKAWRIQPQLPHYQIHGKPEVRPLVSSGNFYLNVEDVRSYALTTVIGIDLSTPRFSFTGLAYFGSPDSVYASTKALYLTRSLYDNRNQYRLDINRFPPRSNKTLIHKFAYQGHGFDYRGSGVILGNLKWNEMSTFQLDEDQKGNLRVVSYNWNTGDKQNKSNDPATRSPVILTALAEQPGRKQLVTLSRLPNRYFPQPLGKKNEQLYGARLFDDYAYLVTFRRTDPLYVIDMRNPRAMKVTGKLIIPGFSDYLHPIDRGLLLGIGKEAEVRKDGRVGRIKGVKLSLFDIRNPNRPREVSKIVIGDRNSDTPVSRDYHALTTLKLDNSSVTRVLLPVSLREKQGNYRYKNTLQRFEVDSRAHKIRHLGAIQSKQSKRNWYWNNNDRSIIIGDRVFYYHNGQFQEAPWYPYKKAQKVVN